MKTKIYDFIFGKYPKIIVENLHHYSNEDIKIIFQYAQDLIDKTLIIREPYLQEVSEISPGLKHPCHYFKYRKSLEKKSNKIIEDFLESHSRVIDNNFNESDQTTLAGKHNSEESNNDTVKL